MMFFNAIKIPGFQYKFWYLLRRRNLFETSVSECSSVVLHPLTSLFKFLLYSNLQNSWCRLLLSFCDQTSRKLVQTMKTLPKWFQERKMVRLFFFFSLNCLFQNFSTVAFLGWDYCEVNVRSHHVWILINN